LGEVPRLLAVEPRALRDRAQLHHAHELIVLPLERVELEARIARAGHAVYGVGDRECACVGSLELDLASYRVTIDGVPVAFAHLEYELLKFLVTHRRRVFSREALLRQVWGYDFYGGARTVDVHVRRLRAKLGPQHAGCIRTVRSVGYCFDASMS
jgi:two-component system, OmpR family, alkaline phosphatase synthesis response regulator PhoP